MGVKLVSASGGSVEINPPATASNFVATMPAGTGTVAVSSAAVSAAGQVLFSTDGATLTPTAKIVSGTAVNASGTSVDFTGIPSWAKRITVMVNSLSTNGSSNIIVQVGNSGGVETTGYVNSIGNTTSASANAGSTFTNGCNIPCFAAASSISGQVVFSNLSGLNWVFSGLVADPVTPRIVYSAGIKTLAAALDRIRVTTANGTDTFDAGAINILYE